MIDVRFYPEYFCTSLQLKKDIFLPTEYKNLPLSEQLISELEKLDEEIMNVIDWGDPGGESPMSFEERERLYEFAKELCHKVENELGENYNVIDCSDWLKPE
ncbi:MAG: hypothetical protein IJZ47_05580 [Oscillospiraceae bacterium]|nr:hypothetical protein [Oscillospiraceae bacterium]